MLMWEVTDRKAQTLLPIIESTTRSTVMSAQWRAYSQITTLGISHQTVNHSLHFIEPGKKEVMGTSDDLFPTYLPECL